MSSYSCIVPVDWNILWGHVLPAWLAVLAASLDQREFYATYVPAGDIYGDLLDERYTAPADYLSLFKPSLNPPYLSANLQGSGKCSDFLRKADAGTYLLDAAVKQSATFDLPGFDPFADNAFGWIDCRTGRRQVAGTKNVYTFLDRAFAVSGSSQDYYAYSRRDHGASPQLQGLLESLFLYQRAIPGAWFLPYSPAWPKYDDLSFAGYLCPEEVISLQSELASWSDHLLVEDVRFQLFANRVSRTAQTGGGLLTIHAGL